jgi:hypothetical protein
VVKSERFQWGVWGRGNCWHRKYRHRELERAPARTSILERFRRHRDVADSIYLYPFPTGTRDESITVGRILLDITKVKGEVIDWNEQSKGMRGEIGIIYLSGWVSCH